MLIDALDREKPLLAGVNDAMGRRETLQPTSQHRGVQFIYVVEKGDWSPGADQGRVPVRSFVYQGYSTSAPGLRNTPFRTADLKEDREIAAHRINLLPKGVVLYIGSWFGVNVEALINSFYFGKMYWLTIGCRGPRHLVPHAFHPGGEGGFWAVRWW